MKDVPIGKLFELVAKGRVCVIYEIDTPQGVISTCNESSIVTFYGSIGKTQVDHRALADAIRERCAG